MPAEAFSLSQLPGVLLQLLAGLGLFLFGMNTMSEGLEKVAGQQLKNLLGTVTQNRFLQVLLGFVITVLMQSSSATTVMLVGFVNAGVMALSQAVGCIMGANIGTTLTVLMMSIDLPFEYLFCFVGCVLLFLPAQFKKLKGISPVIFGVGALFIGMMFMSEAMKPLRTWSVFTEALKAVDNPIVAVLIGAGITALIQSSAASIAILLPLAQMGFISFEMCMFILFGQNIGTCVTAVLACLGTSSTSKRVACVHLLFNVIGTIFFVVMTLLLKNLHIFDFAGFIESIVPDILNEETGMMEPNVKMMISVTHIIFNTITTLLLLPFCTQLEKLACKIIRSDDNESEALKLLHFDERMLRTPAVAAEQLFNEVQRMGSIARSNFVQAMECFHEWNEETAAEIIRNEEVLDFLNKEITTCLVEVKGLDLDERDTRLIGSLFHVVNDMERVGDHAQNILEAAQLRQTEGIKFSPKAIAELESLSDMVIKQLERALAYFRDQVFGQEGRKLVEDIEQQIDDTTESLRQHHVDRLKQHKCSAKNGMIYLDILTNLERIGDHAENIATSVDKQLTHAHF
ncbi:MAG: Na/Pi cotransporter family protein [Clostridia bacterium]|nr:Na/Pi cotransporter family protein [Clostridia bacterium]